jgi:hypothetical protein
VQSKETQIEARAQSRHDQLLFGHRWSGFLENRIDLIERPVAADKPAANGSVGREEALPSGLDGRHRCALGDGNVDQLARAAGRAMGHVQVIADQMEKRLVAHELAAAQDGVAVSTGVGLRHETDAAAKCPTGVGVRGLVTRADDDTELFDTRPFGLLQDHLQGGLWFAVLVDERLQRQGPLETIGSRDERFPDVHGRVRDEGYPMLPPVCALPEEYPPLEA